MIIRPITLADKAAWYPLWKGYQSFYKTDIEESVSDNTFARFLDEKEPVNALVAEDNGVIIGFVHYIFHKSCWTTSDYVYLQDLYVNENIRGKGVGRKLIEAVYEAARKAGAGRVHWLTNEDNHQARILYDNIAVKTGFIQYRKML
jgi:GNAT superfamily N-acetyltransferase